MHKFFTGVGSRETPDDILTLMRGYSKAMVLRSWVLRSGGANGADSAFCAGWFDALYENINIQDAEIYLLWHGFNDYSKDSKNCKLVVDKAIISQAQEILRTVHPAYERLTRGPLALHTRNVYQVLGSDLKTPSRGLVAYAKLDKHGEPMGGTRTAIKIAEMYNIPCLNLFKDEDRARLEKYLEGLE